MNEKTALHPVTTIQEFETQWDAIVQTTAAAFRMDKEETAWLRTKPIARLIASIPFFAGSRNAARTAVTHLGTYLLSIKETKPFYNANHEDDGDILDRLNLINTFDGGDQKIIDRGMALIAMSMVEDYKRDIQIDAAIGKHNPVATGAFDFDAIHEELRQRIEAVDCPAMDAVLSMGDIGTMGYWSNR